MPPYTPLSSFDYRESNIYSHILGDFSEAMIRKLNIIQHVPASCSSNLVISTLDWSQASFLIDSPHKITSAFNRTIQTDDINHSEYEFACYSRLLAALSYFSSEESLLLSEHIESFKTSAIPLQEFWLYKSYWCRFSAKAKSEPFLLLMAFYSAVVVGDMKLAQTLESSVHTFMGFLPKDSSINVMISNIFCLYFIRLGQPLSEILDLNREILNHASVDHSELRSILLLNRARLLARLGFSVEALAVLQSSYSLRCSLTNLPCGLTLLYALYYLRWSDSVHKFSTLFDLIGEPGLTSLSWRFSSLLGVPSNTRLIFVNRRFTLPSHINHNSTLAEIVSCLEAYF
jgi:hypothetical protein